MLEPGGEQRSVLPHELIAVEATSHLDAWHPDRPQNVYATFDRADDRDGRATDSGHIVHAVLDRAVGPHVVDDASSNDADPISALLDALHVAGNRIGRRGTG